MRSDMADEDMGRTQDRAVYIISVAAELAGVHPQTLRIYERKGLVRPARTAGNTRRYSERDIARLRTIQELTQAGVNLAGVKMIIELQREVERVRRELEEQLEALERERGRRRKIVRMLQEQRGGDLVPLREAVLPWESGPPTR
jgi:MerR family transcriptional regulator/heat shock protein HspR